MNNSKATYAEKSQQELSAILCAYLTGKQENLSDQILHICEILASRQTPPADPLEVYRSHLALCFPDAVNSDR